MSSNQYTRLGYARSGVNEAAKAVADQLGDGSSTFQTGRTIDTRKGHGKASGTAEMITFYKNVAAGTRWDADDIAKLPVPPGVGAAAFRRRVAETCTEVEAVRETGDFQAARELGRESAYAYGAYAGRPELGARDTGEGLTGHDLANLICGPAF